jgi:paraquat-inducible protein B
MKVSNTAIGTFVLSALGLGTVFVVLLGSGALFRDSFTLAFDFEGDVSGLAVGAPVTIKGFRIGTVRELRLDYDVDTRAFRTRALAEMTPQIVPMGSEERVAGLLDPDMVDAARERILRDMIEDGARAQLDLQSLVTGLLQIDIDFPPEPAPATLELSDEGHWLIPTQKSNLEILQRTLTDLPLRELADESTAALRALRALAESPDLARGLSQVDEIAEGTRALLARLDSSVGRIEAQVDAALEAFEELTAQGTRSLATADDAVQANSRRVADVLESAEQALDEIAVLAGALNGGEARDSALARDLAGTLQSAARALDALRNLAEYLERHPEALLRGKD